MNHAPIQEVFSSIQGEGPWIGERHIFVRFLGCDIRCRYCDTPAALCTPEDSLWKFCKVQMSSGLNDLKQVPNPISGDALTKFCTNLIIPGPSRPTISLTGGEPLLHHEFLREWLPHVQGAFRIYLETNGIHADAMRKVRDLVDIVSMDFKLPSATGLRPFWEEHRRFLEAAKGKQLFIKAVVTKDTTQEDIITSASIIAGSDKLVPFIIQPAGGVFAPGPEILLKFQETALRTIADVRVIPQAHTILHVR
jgi:7-carboxy-7-deazaguanine synthase